jgi:hypothetical protein
MSHSTIVGGSTASRVINCPGSVALVAKMPPARQALTLTKAHCFTKSWPSYLIMASQNLMTS